MMARSEGEVRIVTTCDVGRLKEVWRHTRHIWGKGQWTAKFMSPTRHMWQN